MRVIFFGTLLAVGAFVTAPNRQYALIKKKHAGPAGLAAVRVNSPGHRPIGNVAESRSHQAFNVQK